eukprot:6182816-Pleurochrysis_carterae.AAC.1
MRVCLSKGRVDARALTRRERQVAARARECLSAWCRARRLHDVERALLRLAHAHAHEAVARLLGAAPELVQQRH